MTVAIDPAVITPPYVSPVMRALSAVVSYEVASGLDHVEDSPLVLVGSLLADLDAWCVLHGVDLDDAREIARSVRFNDSAGVGL